jgi:hypothetical protein
MRMCYILDLCGEGLEYLLHDPASHRRRRKGKSQMWDSKIWLWVPRDWDPRKIALARVRSICKRQTHPLMREDAPQKQDRSCQRVINTWSWALDGARHQDLLTDWLSVSMWLWLRLEKKKNITSGGIGRGRWTPIYVQSSLCRVLMREVNAVTVLVKDSYKWVVSWRSESRRIFSSKVPEWLKMK